MMSTFLVPLMVSTSANVASRKAQTMISCCPTMTRRKTLIRDRAWSSIALKSAHEVNALMQSRKIELARLKEDLGRSDAASSKS
jgi:hypothetical protein